MSYPTTPRELNMDTYHPNNGTSVNGSEDNAQKVNKSRVQDDAASAKTRNGNQNSTVGVSFDKIASNKKRETEIADEDKEDKKGKAENMTFDDDDDDDLKMALALSMQMVTEQTQGKIYHKDAKSYENTAVDIRSFHQIMWDNSVCDITGTTQEDQFRWMSQGIVLSSFNTANRNSNFDNYEINEHFQHRPKWGLVQNHGGPCGVLAAIQAEVLRIILFESDQSKSKSTFDYKDKGSMRNLKEIGGNEEDMKDCVALAMSRILVRTAMAPKKSEDFVSIDSPCVKIVFPLSSTASSIKTNNYKGLKWEALNPWPWDNDYQAESTVQCESHLISLSHSPASNSFQNFNNPNVEEELITKTWIFLKENMQYFHADGGVLLFVMSLVETRGAETIKSGT